MISNHALSNAFFIFNVFKYAVSRAGKYSQAVRNGPSQNAVSNLGLKP